MDYTLIALDLAAVSILTFAFYLPRHRRRDLAVAYIGVNIGVFAVATALSSSDVGVGLGLGLFGVLSIIRLRSAELEQNEVAYYFAALALGLLSGLGAGGLLTTSALMAMVVIAIGIADSNKVLSRYRRAELVLGRAISDEQELVVELESLLHATVHRVQIRKLDTVNDTTTVEVRYEQQVFAPMLTGAVR